MYHQPMRVPPTRVAVAATVMAAGLVCLLPRVTRACSPKCIESKILPNKATQQVPANTRIWFLGYLGKAIANNGFAESCESDQPPRLESDSGEVIATTLTRTGDAAFLTPLEPLTEGEAYVVRVSCLPFEVQDTTFEVTAPVDVTAPAVPTVRTGTLFRESDECFNLAYRNIEASGGDPLYFVDLHADAVLDGTYGENVAVEGVTDELTKLGHTGCDPGYWPDAARTHRFRFAAVDLAGNRSEWTEPMSVTREGLPVASACNCSIERRERRGLAWASLVLGVVLLRRRRTAD